MVGVHGDAIKIQIASPPVDGAANDAIVRYVAKVLDVPRGSITLVQGERSRHKIIEVSGMGVAEVAERLEGAIS